jgi:hypothetical protein
MSPNLPSRATECGQVRPTSSKRVTAQHTLERVRNNQRRHRAQRREYIATLELKLGHSEQRIAALEEQVDALQAELAQYRKQDASTSLLGRRQCTDGTPPATQPSPGGLDSQAVGPLADAAERDTVTPSSLPLFPSLLPDSPLGPELVDPASPDARGDNLDGADDLRPLMPLHQPPNPIAGAPIAAVSWPSGRGADCPCRSRNVPDVALQRVNYQLVGGPGSWLSAAGALYSTPLEAQSCCSSRRALQSGGRTPGEHNHDRDPRNAPSSPGYVSQSPITAHYGHTTDNESTMLCAEAYLLIEQQNFMGVHQRDVATWLWSGFRESPNPGEGCRVKTDLLFSLLAFISGA